MKNSLIAISNIFLIFSLPAYAQPHDGFYLGVRGGVLQSFANASTASNGLSYTSSGTEFLSTTSENIALGHSYGEGDLFIGYGKQINCTPFYVGGEIFINEATRKNTVSNETADAIVSETSSLISYLNSSTRVKLNSFEFGIDLKPGMLINPQTLLYGRIGISSNELQVTSNSSFSLEDSNGNTALTRGRASSSQHITGWRFGLGLEEYLYSCFAVTVDYIYTTYGGNHGVSSTTDTLNTIVADAVGTLETSGSGKISTQAFLVGVKYSFG